MSLRFSPSYSTWPLGDVRTRTEWVMVRLSPCLLSFLKWGNWDLEKLNGIVNNKSHGHLCSWKPHCVLGTFISVHICSSPSFSHGPGDACVIVPEAKWPSLQGEKVAKLGFEPRTFLTSVLCQHRVDQAAVFWVYTWSEAIQILSPFHACPAVMQ